MRRFQRGFTYMEIIIIAAVAAVLLGIAYANYSHWIDRARIAHAIGDIGEIQLKAQMFDLNNNRYPTNLAELGIDDLNDPWGNPYQFLSFDGMTGNGPKRKNKSMVPVNTQFDVYSMGPDGKTASPFTSIAGQDDVVMAGDGTYFGLASKY